MTSRRNFLSILFAICLVSIGLNFVPPAFALGGKLPPVNQPAPEFTLPTNRPLQKRLSKAGKMPAPQELLERSNSGDGKISLSDYRGKWLVVYFYPKDFTSGCTLEARRFQQDLPKYRSKNSEILGISVDDVNSHAEFCDSEGLKFPLLADTDGKVSKAYGSWMSFISARHSFIIDPEGILRETFVKVNPAIHSQEILARLDELQST